MKKSLLLLSLVVLAASCKKDSAKSLPSGVEWKTMKMEYFSGASNQYVQTILPTAGFANYIEFSGGQYSIKNNSGTSQAVGSYTEDYITHNSQPGQKFYFVEKTSTKMVCKHQTATPDSGVPIIIFEKD